MVIYYTQIRVINQQIHEKKHQQIQQKTDRFQEKNTWQVVDFDSKPTKTV